MIGIIVELLNMDDYYGVSESIDIAKGKYKVPMTFKDARDKINRQKAWRRK